MTDVVDRQTRSRMMAGIKGRNTLPEMAVRKALHREGYRFSLHSKNLPGRPDLVLRKYGAVIFVNGCFWHGHKCHFFRWPRTRSEFWRKKINGNIKRDIRNRELLYDMGWRVCIIWECSLRGKTMLGIETVIGSLDNWVPSSSPCLEIPGT